MTKIPDTSGGIAGLSSGFVPPSASPVPPVSAPYVVGPKFAHVVAGMHIGQMTMDLPQRFAAVLTVAEQPGTVPEGVVHRHIHLSYLDMDPAALDRAVGWVLDQLTAERTVLVRSEGGKQRPGLVVAMAILRLGGWYYDAIRCVTHARSDALTDFRYLAMLKAADRDMNDRLRSRSR